ncbi:MAG TPA: hypothetical protein VN815_04050 [Steroidobacteraceae bacterium]|jgi:hypothetical protein|nr:hypothetical protein [Steroidobacteraceae bacterium]
MRLARPVYESLPAIYVLIGGAAIFLFYINPPGFAGKAAFVIGLFALTAGVTLFLRRQDYRELSREYNGENIELPSNLNR